jgi:hypothetical protein
LNSTDFEGEGGKSKRGKKIRAQEEKLSVKNKERKDKRGQFRKRKSRVGGNSF